MKNLLLIVVVLMAASASAQLAPTKAQHARLVKAKEHLNSIQAKMLHLQAEYQSLEAEQAFVVAQMGQACREIIIENNWPLTTQCVQSLNFVEMKVPPAALPTPPAPEVKKDQPAIEEPKK